MGQGRSQKSNTFEHSETRRVGVGVGRDHNFHGGTQHFWCCRCDVVISSNEMMFFSCWCRMILLCIGSAYSKLACFGHFHPRNLLVPITDVASTLIIAMTEVQQPAFHSIQSFIIFVKYQMTRLASLESRAIHPTPVRNFAVGHTYKVFHIRDKQCFFFCFRTMGA